MTHQIENADSAETMIINISCAGMTRDRNTIQSAAKAGQMRIMRNDNTDHPQGPQ